MYKPNNELGLSVQCLNCEKQSKSIRIKGAHKGYCHTCYKKLFWKPKLIICKRCKREMIHQAHGLCMGCYNSVYHIEVIKASNTKRYHNISHELYKQVTKECVLCGFNKIVDLHHIDLNHDNNSADNLTGLCPNHHKMIHHRDYRKEVFSLLKEKGFNVPEIYEDDEFYKNQATPSTHKKKFEKENEDKMSEIIN